MSRVIKPFEPEYEELFQAWPITKGSGATLMSNTPKRLWLDPTSEDCLGMFCVSKTSKYVNMDIEYILKDIADELAEALERSLAENRRYIGLDYNDPVVNIALAKYRETEI